MLNVKIGMPGSRFQFIWPSHAVASICYVVLQFRLYQNLYQRSYIIINPWIGGMTLCSNTSVIISCCHIFINDKLS